MLTRGVHGPPYAARPHRWPRAKRCSARSATAARPLRTRTFEDRFATLHTTQRLRCASRRGVHGARASLRHDDAFRGSSRKHRRILAAQDNWGDSNWGCLSVRGWDLCLCNGEGYGLVNGQRNRGLMRRDCRRGSILRSHCGRMSHRPRFRLMGQRFCADSSCRGSIGSRSSRWPYHDGPGRRPGSDRRRSRRWSGNDLRSLTRLRHDFAWSRRWRRSAGCRLRPLRRNRCSRRGSSRFRLRGRDCRCGSHRGPLGRRPRYRRCLSTTVALLFLLLNGFQNVARLGNVRKIDLWLIVVRSSARPRGGGPASANQRGAHTHRLVFLHGTRVRLLFRNADFKEKIENNLTLYL